MALLHSSLKDPYDPDDHQYPKWIHRDGKESVLVDNEDEETAFLAGDEGSADATCEGPQAEREALMVTLDAAGVKYDKRWGVEKLRAALP